MRCKSFAEAARYLGEDPSKVSRGIQALEARLGLRLFHRTTRSLTPTEAAEVLTIESRSLLEGLDLIEQRVRDVESAPSGRIRLAVPVSFGLANVFPKLIPFLEA